MRVALWPKIITEYFPSPGTFRGCDWTAFYEGDEEGGLRGYGATEQQAIENLVEEMEGRG